MRIRECRVGSLTEKNTDRTYPRELVSHNKASTAHRVCQRLFPFHILYVLIYVVFFSKIFDVFFLNVVLLLLPGFT